MATISICRFGRDLRLEDHAALTAAAERGAVLPVLILDPAFLESLKRSPRRAAFYCSAVRALDEALRERGSALIVRRGAPAPLLLELAKRSGTRAVAWSRQYGGDTMRFDTELQSELEEAGLEAILVHDAPAIAPEQIEGPSDGIGYRAFQPYFERWRRASATSYDRPLLLRFAATEIKSEPLPTPQEFASDHLEPDVSPRLATTSLEQFLASTALQYTTARHVPSEDATSRLGAHFSFGVLASRTAVRATLHRLEDPFLLNEEQLSLRLFLRSLALRDFFIQLAWFHPETDRLELQEKMRGFTFAREHPALNAWRTGETGFALVDAGMRQLHHTGWMHPHVRAVVASFLCFDLGIDWKIGRDEWDRLLIEDDLAIATGNWQWIAGVGADMAQYPRIYNPERQQRRFDPDARYVRRWIPELAKFPSPAWQRGREIAPMLPLYEDGVYPARILDHTSAARAFLARYRSYLTSVTGDAPPANR